MGSKYDPLGGDNVGSTAERLWLGGAGGFINWANSIVSSLLKSQQDVTGLAGIIIKAGSSSRRVEGAGRVIKVGDRAGSSEQAPIGHSIIQHWSICMQVLSISIRHTL